jgi:hypothetical protein
MEQYTEDDTFIASRRIPYNDINKRLGNLSHALYRNEETKRMNARIQERNKIWWRKIRNKVEPQCSILDDDMFEKPVSQAMAGSGWDIPSYLKEINKIIDKDEAEAYALKRKRRIGTGVVISLYGTYGRGRMPGLDRNSNGIVL